MNIKKQSRIVYLIDLCFAMVVTLLLLQASTEPAYAYVDPSVMTYTIQAIAGVAVALSAVLGVVYRRIRRKLMRVLHIDENAGKIVEPHVSRIDSSQKSVADERAAQEGMAALRHEQAPSLSWKKRLVVCLIVSVSLVLTVCFVSPCELVATNEGELVFGLDLVWPTMALVSVSIAVIMALLLSLIRGKAFYFTMGILTAISLGFLIQLLFLNAGLPVADGSEFQLFDHKRIVLLDTVVWVALIAAAIYVIVRKPSLAMRGAVALCIFVVVVQGLYAGTFFGSQPSEEDGKVEYAFITEEGMFDLAPKNNVVVFVLDTIDNRVFAEMLEDYPDYFDDLTGFTAYTDVAGGMIPTRYAVPYLLTGEYPQVDESLDDYLAARYDRSSFIEDMKNEGYSVGVYSDASLGAQGAIKSISDDTINIHVIDGDSANDEMDKIGSFLALCKCALFKDVPWLMKPLFWFDTNAINNAMVKTRTENGTSSSHGAYTIDDVRFFESLTDNPVSISDFDHEGAFRFYHLNGMHVPIELDENAQYVELDVSASEESSGGGGQHIINQGLGNFTIVNEYIEQLKALDLYDDTAIIITSDHGISMYGETQEWYTMPPSLESPATPIFLFKPSETAEGAARPLAFSDAPIGHSEFIPTVMRAIGADGSPYGVAVSEVPDGERIRYSYMTLSDAEARPVSIRKYVIRGDVNDFANWESTDEEWSISSW